MLRTINKLAIVFAWINWLLSAVCLAVFVFFIVFAYQEVEAKWENKAYAFIIMLGILLFPAIFFFINGLILKSKSNSDTPLKNKVDDLLQ